MRRHLFVLSGLLLLAALVVAVPAASAVGSPAVTQAYHLLLPMVVAPPPLPPISWDPRLDQRWTVIIPADVQPGQGYWRLVKGVWYGPDEPPYAGQTHIYVDTRNSGGERQPGVPIDFTNLDGTMLLATIVTELKPGEPYAANFIMGRNVAPAYRAIPNDGNPADAVTGMGLGSIEDPTHWVHTSYGFVWEWTIAPPAPPTPQPTATVTPTATAAPEVSATPTSTPEATEAPTLTPEVTETPTPTPEATEAILSLHDPTHLP